MLFSFEATINSLKARFYDETNSLKANFVFCDARLKHILDLILGLFHQGNLQKRKKC